MAQNEFESAIVPAQHRLKAPLGPAADLERWTRIGTGTSLAEVAPDGDRAGLLVGGRVILVDLATGTVLSRVRTDCTARFDNDTRLFQCGAAIDSIEPPTSYLPLGIGLLWGSP